MSQYKLSSILGSRPLFDDERNAQALRGAQQALSSSGGGFDANAGASLLNTAGGAIPGVAGDAVKGAGAGVSLGSLLGGSAMIPATGGLAALGLVAGLLRAKFNRDNQNRELQRQADTMRAKSDSDAAQAIGNAALSRSATLRSLFGGTRK